MSSLVLLAVLAGAFLHASWNLLVKAGRDTQLAAAGVYIGAGLIAGGLVGFVPPPPRASWPYLAASTAAELLYGALLARAYRSGDLSHAYPLMRGAAPLLVAVGSAALIGERLSRAVWIGIGLLSCGIISMIFDTRAQARAAATTRLALLIACVIATYTTIDGVGARVSGEPLAYTLWLSALIAVPWLTWALWRYRGSELRGQLPAGLLGGACSLVSYAVALWAMTRAPVAAVSAVRETSVVFATVLGALVLRERVTWIRALGVGAIALGVWMIRGR